MTKSTNPTLTGGRKFGYESGIVSESILYNMFYVYFIIFLTNTVGMKPALAGTVSLIAVLVDALTDPIIGYLTDKKGVDKKKFIIFGGIAMGFLFTASFIVLDGSQLSMFFYYVIISSLFWCAYTCLTIPYYSICPQLTEDYDERTKIRGVSSFINSFAIYAGIVFPVVFISMYMEKGVSANLSWTLSAATISLIAVIFAVIIYVSLKKVKLIEINEPDETLDNKKGPGIFKTYLEIMKLKPIRFFVPFVFIYLFGSAMVSSNTQYLIQYRVGANPELVTLTMIVLCITMMVFASITTWLATKTDRKTALIIIFGIAAVGVIGCKIHGIDSIFMVYVLTFVSTIATAGFWTLFYNFAYDIIALDEYANGTRREGAITAFPQLVQKLGNAVGLWTFGMILAAVGYDATLTTQSHDTIIGIENVSTIYLAIAIIVSIFFIILYPISKKRYNMLNEALEKKRNGEAYRTDELDKIM